MAKKYSIKNIATDPARPIGLMVKNTGVADGQGCVQVVPQSPVVLTDAEYATCKKAIKRYEKADMLAVTVLDDGSGETDKVEDIDELREEAKELGVKSWHVMGADKLIAAIAEAKKEAE